MNLLLATSNPHKHDEILAVWSTRLAEPDAPTINFLTLADLDLDIPEPIEDQPTFEGNAALKADYYASHANLPCIADDSGLEVDALNGAPGVISARYAGKTGPRSSVDPANNRKLLTELGQLPARDRSARFVCAMALAWPTANGDNHPVPPIVVRGTIEGRILGPGDEGFLDANPPAGFRGRGQNGFGYDPLFLVPRLNKTTAELAPNEKNAISHRGQAARLLWDHLRNHFSATA